MSRHRPVDRTLADHDLGRDEGLASAPRARHPPGAQAGHQFAAQHSPTLSEQCLIIGLMADAHGLVVREVDRQAASARGDGLWGRAHRSWSRRRLSAHIRRVFEENFGVYGVRKV